MRHKEGKKRNVLRLDNSAPDFDELKLEFTVGGSVFGSFNLGIAHEIVAEAALDLAMGVLKRFHGFRNRPEASIKLIGTLPARTIWEWKRWALVSREK